MKNVYISCPMTVSQTVLDEVINLVRKHAIPQWWTKGTAYNEKAYTEAIRKYYDAIVVILPAMQWSCNYNQMTSGSRKELCIAIQAKKPIYLAYKTSTGVLGIYSTNIVHNNNEITTFFTISGVASTSYNFEQDMKVEKALNIKLPIEDYWTKWLKEIYKQQEKAIWVPNNRTCWEEMRKEMEEAGLAVRYPIVDIVKQDIRILLFL